MANERDNTANEQFDETAPGTIVAGPDAHAREWRGQDPAHKTRPAENGTPGSRRSVPDAGKDPA